MSRRAGGVVHDEDGVLYFTGGHPLPVLLNGVMRTDGRLPAEELLARAREFFHAAGRGYSVFVRAHADEDLSAAATAAGLVDFRDAPGMVLDRRIEDREAPAGIILRRVETAADAADYARVMGPAFATLGMPPDVASQIFARTEALKAPHIVAFLASQSGVPVAGAMTIVTHGVAGVYWVGTTPEARGRGLAELCTRVAGNAGFDVGARIAALQASPMGEPVYLRMGYVEVTRYACRVQFEPPEKP
jgi:hypothetical protein